MEVRQRYCILAGVTVLTGPNAFGAQAQSEHTDVYPVAVLKVQERGAEVEGLGSKVTDLFFASLATDPQMHLVDREDLQKQLDEHQLNLSGLVRPDQAIRVGQLTGAKILVTGSVLQVDSTLYLVGKVIGTETSRVIGCSVKGKVDDDLGELCERLAVDISKAVAERGRELVAKPVDDEVRLATLKQRIGKGKRPTVWIKIDERHVGQPTVDPAAETEMNMLCRELGFTVLDSSAGERNKADIILSGEGFSEFAGRHGNLVSVKARIEIKATDRKTSEVLVADRQTSIGIDLSEQLAGKAALQDAAAELSERLLPKLVKEPDKNRKQKRKQEGTRSPQ